MVLVFLTDSHLSAPTAAAAAASVEARSRALLHQAEVCYVLPDTGRERDDAQRNTFYWQSLVVHTYSSHHRQQFQLRQKSSFVFLICHYSYPASTWKHLPQVLKLADSWRLQQQQHQLHDLHSLYWILTLRAPVVKWVPVAVLDLAQSGPTQWGHLPSSV